LASYKITFKSKETRVTVAKKDRKNTREIIINHKETMMVKDGED